MVTHDLASAISISDRVIVLNNRPSLVKNIYEIKRIENLSPIENRKDKNLNTIILNTKNIYVPKIIYVPPPKFVF